MVFASAWVAEGSEKFGLCLNWTTDWFFSLAFSFERELVKKLGQKSGGYQSEEQTLLRCFKYFDLNANNTVEVHEFERAVEKIGIVIPTKKVSISYALNPTP